MPERSYRVVLWGLALLGLLADQATKYSVFSWLEGVESHTYALFQTEPTSRNLAVVPVEEAHGNVPRGFFLRVDFKLDDQGRLVPHVNHGALFGLFREQEKWANRGFALISLLAAVAIIYWSTQKKTAGDRWLCISLGLILAGTLGNFYDRMLFDGVRDFLHWNWKFDWPVFNVADCCLVLGATLLLVQAFFAPARAQDGNQPEAKKESLPMPVGSSS